jgi:hypothetical protein
MSEKVGTRLPAHMAEVQIPFKFTVVHGMESDRRSSQHNAVTKSLNLIGLVFETPTMEVDNFHLSFTESTYGRNSLEVSLDLGKRFGVIELTAQVDWYERRPTAMGYAFTVGISFLDPPIETVDMLREYLQMLRTLAK